MSLEIIITSDIKQAMLDKNSKKLEALRAVKASLLLAKTSKTIGSEDISKEIEISILKKLIKQRKDSAAIYYEKGRKEMAEEELYQANVIEKYLPKQLNESEIEKIVKETITDLNASSIKDIGKVMGIVIKKLSGNADNKVVAEIVKKLLTS